MKQTEHPAEAFEALRYLVNEAAPTLSPVYGSMPARQSLRAADDRLDAFWQLYTGTPELDLDAELDALFQADAG